VKESIIMHLNVGTNSLLFKFIFIVYYFVIFYEGTYLRVPLHIYIFTMNHVLSLKRISNTNTFKITLPWRTLTLWFAIDFSVGNFSLRKSSHPITEFDVVADNIVHTIILRATVSVTRCNKSRVLASM